MTIKLLTDWPYKRANGAGYVTMPAGRVVGVFDAATEAGMIAAKVALASAVAADWLPPSDAPIYDELNPDEVSQVRGVVSGGGNGNGVAESVLSKYGSTALDITLASVVPASTSNMTWSRTAEKQRFGNQTVKIQPTADTGCLITFTDATSLMTCDPDDQLYSVDVYIDTQILDYLPASIALTITLSNTNSLASGNYDAWAFDGVALRMGWNTLKMWSGDDTSGGYRGSNLGYGVIRTKTGTGFDFTQPAKYLGIRFGTMNGYTLRFDQIRRAAKAYPKVIMGFDATGASTSDRVFPDKITPMFAAAGVQSPYFTETYVYDFFYIGGTVWNRAMELYRAGWDAINHTHSHGATVPGRRNTVTLSRTSNLVTATLGATHGIPIGQAFRCKISGATPGDMNGQFWATATTTTAVTYTAAGADGAGTGTIYIITVLADVFDTVSAETQQLIDHEIVDMSRLMRAAGLSRGAHLLAYPNNSVPELTQLDSACRRAGVVLGRGTRGGFCNINEFGIDNPLHIGSWPFESSATLYTTQTMLKRKVQGAIGRGECIIFYGHFVLDETAPANSAHAGANLDFPPGQSGNPAPPAAGVTNADGGWWYLGQLTQFVQWLQTQPVQFMGYRQLADHVSAISREGV